jgi:hypothetical protein
VTNADVIRYEDATAKFCGYIMVSHFIDMYEVPPKIVIQVYHTLLRAFQPEGRALVTREREREKEKEKEKERKRMRERERESAKRQRQRTLRQR